MYVLLRQLFRRGRPGQLRHQLQGHAFECRITGVVLRQSWLFKPLKISTCNFAGSTAGKARWAIIPVTRMATPRVIAPRKEKPLGCCHASAWSRLTQELPLDADSLECVAQFFRVIAIAGHPVEAGHALRQPQAVALEADVDLVAADGQERGVHNLA